MHRPRDKSSLNSIDADLDASVEEAVAQLGKATHVAREFLREEFRLQRDYPGQYVAYIDRWRTRGRRRHLTRTVLAASTSPFEIDEQVRALPPAQQRKLAVDFFQDPNELPGR